MVSIGIRHRGERRSPELLLRTHSELGHAAFVCLVAPDDIGSHTTTGLSAPSSAVHGEQV